MTTSSTCCGDSSKHQRPKGYQLLPGGYNMGGCLSDRWTRVQRDSLQLCELPITATCQVQKRHHHDSTLWFRRHGQAELYHWLPLVWHYVVMVIQESLNTAMLTGDKSPSHEVPAAG
eukprot:GHUV01056366.1.p1 GENE.GHUV01056366.1~~GHUV01056366.1.p1  ORF type:complete len:117 (-),score=18.22 GHUV01056366.1:770-1120(-)